MKKEKIFGMITLAVLIGLLGISCKKKEVIKKPNIVYILADELGYGKDSSPLGLVLEKNFEYCIDLPDAQLSIPWLVYAPGAFFSFSRVWRQQSPRI